jgi:serine protease Do
VSESSIVSTWPPAGPTPRPPAGSRGRGLFLPVLAGALVGALAAGGLFLAFDDGGSQTTIVRTSATPAVVTRPSSVLSGGQADIASIIQKTEPAIVAIAVDGYPDSGTGGAATGFVITPDGYIVTNNHVAEGASKIEITFTNGDIKSAKIVGTDPSTDLAVLKVDGTDLPTLELGDSDTAQVGDEVVAIGNALALEGGLSVTKGIISGTNRQADTSAGARLEGMLQTDAAINLGNSGGPLLDASGKVIGINTAIANPSYAQNVGFVIPISKAKPIIDDLRLGRAPAFLGVGTENITPSLEREQDLSVDSGAYVDNVTGGSPAEDAGIKPGDVIVSIGGTRIASSADVIAAIRSHRPGDEVKVGIVRGTENLEVDAKLTQKPGTG